MKRNAAPILVSVLAALALTAALAAAAGDGGAGDSNTVLSERYDLSVALPEGWHASRSRLVTKLAMPREVVSLGTFGMAPGSGGNCGREPVRAIGRMREGDALLSVQEYVVTARMRQGPARRFTSEPRLGRLTRAGGAYAGGVSGSPVYKETIPFRDSGRAFDALVYFRGRPTTWARAQVDAILAGLDFGPDPVGFGSHA